MSKKKEVDQVVKRRKGMRRGVERLRRRSLVKQYRGEMKEEGRRMSIKKELDQLLKRRKGLKRIRRRS